MKQIAPSMLSADFARLGEEVDRLEAAGADLIHFDAMDNHHVPNPTIGPMICEATRPQVAIPIDVHLMVTPVDELARSFAKAGANIITFLPETTRHVDRTLELTRDLGCQESVATAGVDTFVTGSAIFGARDPDGSYRGVIWRDAPGTGLSTSKGTGAGSMNTAAPLTEDRVNLGVLYSESNISETLSLLDRDLIGLVPVKTRIREIAALLLVEAARRGMGIQADPPSLHMSFTGNPGTGKTTVARRMADVLFRLKYIRRNHVVTVTRDDLVGQFIGHTAPKTKEVLKKAMGGVLFIDEAYYLYRPENERDYGQEAIEILLQMMEDHREDLVVILAGYKDRMDTFFRSNPGMASRIAHHIDFPDYSADELFEIAQIMAGTMHYRFDAEGAAVLHKYIVRRMQQPRFSNARSIRNAIDRARLRMANRLFADRDRPVDRAALETITAPDLLASRVFTQE